MSIGFTSCEKEFSSKNCREDNKPPNAVAGRDQVITLPSDSISLDGSSSGDPDGMKSEWLWMKITGPASFSITNTSTTKTRIKKLIRGIYQD